MHALPKRETIEDVQNVYGAALTLSVPHTIG